MVRSTRSTPLPCWCHMLKPQPSSPRTPLVAAAGILSTEARTFLRSASRATWLANAPAALAARFVLRGIGLSGESATLLRAEWAKHKDLVLLNASATLPRQYGPIVSLHLWLQCAARLFPEVPFVGKLDDDAWMSASGVSGLLHGLLPWVDKPWAAYTGKFESFSWNVERHSPESWRPASAWAHCSRNQSSRIRGPFGFAKGAAFFVSQKLAQRLIIAQRSNVAHIANHSGCVVDRAADGIPGSVKGPTTAAAPAESGGGCAHALNAWEDVWMGYVVSQDAAGPVVLVDWNRHLVDKWRAEGHSGILAWHSRSLHHFPQDAALLSKWASANPCGWSGIRPFECGSDRILSCAGKPLARCYVSPPAACGRSAVLQASRSLAGSSQPRGVGSHWVHDAYTSRTRR